MQLVRHSRRPEWGLGLVVRELADKAEIVFEDGSTRTLLRTLEFLLPVSNTELAQNSPLRARLDTNGATPTAPVAHDEQRNQLTAPVLLKILRTQVTESLDRLTALGILEGARRRDAIRGVNDIASDLALAVRTSRGSAQTVSDAEASDALTRFTIGGIIEEIKLRINAELPEEAEQKLRRYVHARDAEEDLDAMTAYLSLDPEARIDEDRALEFVAQISRRATTDW